MALLTMLPVFLIPFSLGFFAMAFLWRWWLLLPVATAAVAFAAHESVRLSNSEGIEAAFAGVALILTAFGAASGFLASVIIMIGRRKTNVRTILAIPACFFLGLGSYLAMVVIW
jgi:hypothetical protein